MKRVSGKEERVGRQVARGARSAVIYIDSSFGEDSRSTSVSGLGGSHTRTYGTYNRDEVGEDGVQQVVQLRAADRVR